MIVQSDPTRHLGLECPAQPRVSGRGRHPPHINVSWADAVTSAQLDAPAHSSGKQKVSALFKPIIPITGNKTHYQVMEWVRRGVTALVQRLSWRVAALGARLYAVDDRTAIQHGWAITRRHGGLSRTYRDPRFDMLQACPRCDGEGAIDDQPCVLCDGTGRVTTGPVWRREKNLPTRFEGQRS